jgi:hypothetical protein
MIPPFYPGQKIVAVDAVPGAYFKNGTIYTCRTCHWSINPVNGLGPFCYIGVYGYDGDWYRAAIFAPIEEAKLPLMTFSEIAKIEKQEILINN